MVICIVDIMDNYYGFIWIIIMDIMPYELYLYHIHIHIDIDIDIDIHMIYETDM